MSDQTNVLLIEEQTAGAFTGNKRTAKAADKLILASEFQFDAGLDIGADQTIHGLGAMTLDVDGDLTLDVEGDFLLDLGDAAGANKFAVRDSASGEVFSVDSDGNAIFAGSVFVEGDRIEIDATVSLNRDNILVVSSAPGALSDGGLMVERYYTAWGASDENGTAQAGSTGTTIKLAAGANAGDDYYNGWSVATTGGTGPGQQRTITDYDGTSKVATVDRAWAVTPDGTTTYDIHTTADRYVGVIWDESASEFVVGRTHIDPGTGNVVFEGRMDFRAGEGNFEGGLILSQAADTITHSGGTSLTIASTTGFVAIESVQFAGANIGVTGDTDLLQLASAQATINGNLDVTLGLDVTGAALTAAAGLTLTSVGLTMTGLNIGAAGAEIGDIFGDGFIRLGESASAPDHVANKGFLYLLDVAGATELHYTDHAGNDLQITNAGALNIGALSFALDDAYNDGRTITVDEGPVILDHSTTSGILELQPGLIGETAAALKIVFTALEYTGTLGGIEVDYSAATSLTNAASIYGALLKGKTNAGAGASVGLRIDANWDKGAQILSDLEIEADNVYIKNAMGTTTGLTWDGAALTFNFGAVIPDSMTLALGTDSDFTVSHGGTHTIFDNTFATGSTIMRLGTDTTATSFEVQNDSAGVLLEVDGAGNVKIGGGFGSTGVTITAAGNVSLDGALDVEGAADINGLANLDDVDIDGDVTMATAKEFLVEGFDQASAAAAVNNLAFVMIDQAAAMKARLPDVTSGSGTFALARTAGVWRTGDKGVLNGNWCETILVENDVDITINDELVLSTNTAGRVTKMGATGAPGASAFKVVMGLAASKVTGGTDQTVKCPLAIEKPIQL